MNEKVVMVGQGEEDFVLVSEAARMPDRSAGTVRFYEATGRLPAIKTSNGTRIFRVKDVLALQNYLYKATQKKNLSPAEGDR